MAAPEPNDEASGAVHLGARGATVAATLWASFLTAAIASVVFFAAVDPEDLAHASPLLDELDRRTGYAIAFFFLWAVALVSGALSVYLIRSARREPGLHATGHG